MSRTILAEVDGFTPLLDCLVQEFGVTTAAVFGRVWRYCQMKDEVCYASTQTLGKELELSPHTISSHLDKLVNAGYLEEIQRHGQPSLFKDTGRAGITAKFFGGPIQKITEPIQKLDTTYPKIVQPPIQNLDTKIEVKTESNKEKDNIYSEIFSKLDSMIGCLVGGNSDIDTAEIMLGEFGVERFKKASSWAKEKGFTNMRTALRSMNTALRNGGFMEVKKDEPASPIKYKQVEHIINGELFIERVAE